MTKPSLLVTQEFIDYSGERSTVRYHVPEAAPPEIDATAKGHADSVHDAMAAVTLCNFGTQHISILIDDNARTLPGIPEAQREMAYRVRYVDVDNGGEFEFTLPGPIMTLMQSGSDELDLSDVTVAAAVSNLEGALCSPLAGSIAITSIRFVGRNT
jgi:hypothetical protein